MPSKTELRAQAILRAVRESGTVGGEDLAELLQVSIATVRRDLQELEGRGLLRRTRGGASAIEPLFYEPFRHDSSFQEQVDRNADEKRRIGQAAADMVEHGDVIAVTPGTTPTQVIRNLGSQEGVTVVTSTVNVAMELSGRKNLEVFLTGGYLRGHWFSLVGAAAVSGARRVFPDKMFIGVNGLDAGKGLTSLHEAEAEVIAVMMKQSRRRILVADHSKLGAVATHFIAPAEEAHLLITDRGAKEEQLAPLRALGMEVRLV